MNITYTQLKKWTVQKPTPAIKLKLNVDANWLCTLSGKAKVLAWDARRFNIELEMNWIEGTSNPADKWTVENSFKRWRDNDLAALAVAKKI